MLLPVLNISSDVKDEIRASVATSKVATVSQNNITVGSWTGVGYIIPDTGAGAYRISGGENGGYLNVANGVLLMLIGLILMTATATWVAGFVIAMLGIEYIGIGFWQATGDESWILRTANLAMYLIISLVSFAASSFALGFILGLMWLAFVDWIGPLLLSTRIKIERRLLATRNRKRLVYAI
ncbi:MAG: hypothetical protein DRR00_28090 [Candidatus Parabeggiatoa sp. nov. 3]|nr:MAG: hypothetical protein DRR00_28090 [Gammaproteobacteria bacterium]RKZ58029.1 MAG: hypothetical protein DRQ99_26050 [Gammaproteobacteria bacterium]